MLRAVLFDLDYTLYSHEEADRGNTHWDQRKIEESKKIANCIPIHKLKHRWPAEAGRPDLFSALPLRAEQTSWPGPIETRPDAWSLDNKPRVTHHY